MMLIISVIVLFFDQLTKILALNKLPLGTSTPVIKNVFHLTLVKNSGSAFGLFRDSTTIFIIITIVAVTFILRYLFFKKGHLDIKVRIALFLILAGALGNLMDRLRFGYVIDFLDFRVWPVFNIADSAITIGAILIIWKFMTELKTQSIRK